MQRNMSAGALTMGNVNQARNSFRQAISNVSQLAVQSVQARTATSVLTESIIKRDLTLKQSMQVHRQYTNILREQYALQRAMAVQWTSSTSGRMTADMIIPRDASARIDQMTNSLGANTRAMARGLVGMGGLNEAWSVMRVRIGLASATLSAASESLIKWGKNTQWAGRQLMVGFTVPLMAFGAVAGKAAYDVDAAMTRIQKVYDTTATTAKGKQQELDALRTSSMSMATQVAQKYGQALKDTLGIEADLAATGLKGAQLQQSTVAVTRAATLGELDRQQAIKATIALQSVYHDSADQVNKDFEYMNAIENATSLSMQDFVDAIPRGAGVMKSMGVNLKEMGVLLVALKQNGISAAEGMNGLRSAAQRLLMINPEGATAKAWHDMLPDAPTLKKIVDTYHGEFIPIMQELGKQMKGLEPYQKQEMIARIFGVYQSNKLYGVLDGLVNRTGQVNTAYKIMAQSAGKNSAIAQGELDKMANSASGKFKRMLETIKAQLAKVGEPFLEVGSSILGFISKLLGAFNSMPGMLKKVLAGLVIGGAILGPIIMLVGLFGNLIGQVLKLGGVLSGLLTRFRPLTIEQRAQAMLADQNALAWNNQARAAQTLSAQLQTLTLQMERMAVAQMNANGAGITSLRNPTASTAVIGGIGPTAPSSTSPYQQTANGRYRNTTTGRFVSAAEVNAYAAAQASAARSAQQTAAATTVTQRNWGKIAVAMGGVGLVAASMSAASGSSSTLMNNIMNAVFAASLLGPMLVKAFRTAGIAAAASNMVSAFGFGRGVAAAGGAGAVGRFGAGLAAAVPTAARLGLLIARFAGPVGLLATGAYMAFKLYGNMKKGVETQQRINESAKDWADVLGFVYTEAGQVKDANDQIANSIDAQVTKLKEKNKQLVKSLQLAKDAGDAEKAVDLAIAEGLKVRNHGGSATDAENATRLSLRAAGYKSQQIEELMIKVHAKVDFSDAKSTLNAQMDQFKSDFNKIANNKFGQGSWEGFTRIFGGRGEINKNAAKRGEGMAEEFWTGFQAQTDLQSKKKYFDKFFKSVEAEQHEAWGRLGNSNRKDLKKVGIDSWQEFSQAYRDAQSMTDVEFKNTWGNGDIEQAKKVKGALNSLGSETTRYAEKHIDAEKYIAQAIAKKNNMSDEDIKRVKTLADLYSILDMSFYTVTEAQKGYNEAVQNYNRNGTNLSKTEQLRILNIYRTNAGLDKATSVEQGFGNGIDATTGKLKNNADALADSAASVEDWSNARQKAMSGAQDAALQEAEDIWTRQTDAQIKAIEDNGQRREDALDAQAERQDKRFDDRADAADKRFDRRSKALDKRWDKIMDDFDAKWDAKLKKEQDAYNRRIDNIKAAIQAEQDAEEKRQKIFEAEQNRLERMAEIANKNIDFNVAMNTGNLDEAAKIANDIQSTTTSWSVGDAAAASQSTSDTRQAQMQKQIDSLESARDKRLEDLKKIEDAEKKALQDKKEREQEALQAEKERYNKALQAERERYRKGIEAQKKAIQKETQNSVDALRAELERKKKELDLEIQAVKASVPRTKKEYQAQIKTIEKLYAKYGVNLKASGNDWAKTIGNALTQHMKAASNDVQNTIKWKNIGNNVTQKMVDGGFNMSTSEFMKWVTTGELPKKYKAPKTPKTRHTGGPVSGNSKYDNRGGRNWGTEMRRDESMMLLKNDEFVLNGAAHRALGTDYLDNLNKTGGRGTGGIGGLGMMYQFAAGIEGMYEAAADMAIQAAGNNAMGMGIDGMAIAGAAGKYGNVNLSAEQLKNAATIIGVGKGMGATTRDLIVSIMTAMQESTLRNLHYGDRDSLGLFQQRPSQGWGTPEQILNPSYASRKFFEHLLAMKGRNKLSLAAEAQAVQRSAYPGAYAKWEQMARAVVSGTTFQPFAGLGKGGYVRPVSGPVSRDWAHHSNLPRATDFGVGVGTPVRSAMNGYVQTSTDLKGPGNGGYRSYGRYIVVANGLDRTLYAHLSKRGVSQGSQVRAGQLIGYSGNTGNSTGPHLHFETWKNGKDVPPGVFGIPGLRTGGITLNDGYAKLHAKEAVLTAPLTDQLKSGIQKIDQGINNAYNVTIDLRGAYVRENVDIEKAVNTAINKRESKLGRNRSISS